MSAHQGSDEQRLGGGHTSVVVRVGDTVRRTAGHWTPAVHALLTGLREHGFTDCPTPRGLDEQGREVLDFVPGQVGTLSEQEPLAPWFDSVEAAGRIGDWLRRFHHAQRPLVLDPRLPWRMVPGRPLRPGEVICHHDVSSYNTVRRLDGGLTVLDWDFCRPGDPIEDLAWAAWRWTPLFAGPDLRPMGVDRRQDLELAADKLHALLEGYRADADQRGRLLGAVREQMLSHAEDLERLAVGDPAFASLIERGYAAAARADATWLARHTLRLTGA